ncbi:MAG: hypothetical protein M3P30_01645 [Chloroflexota bacterium]|nr:hypothetical protein [Chloroflexota bacterium]
MMSRAAGMDMNALAQRLRRLATLDTTVFDEVRIDAASTLPAVLVVTIATLLAGIGGWVWWLLADFGGSGKVFLESVIVGTIISVAIWFVWVAITYVVLTQLFRARADVQELIRVMGFASAPFGLMALMFIPGIDFGVALLAIALFFGTTVIAVQSATNAPAGRALVATAAGFAVWAIVLGLVTTSSKTWAPGIFVLDRPIDALRDISSASYF